MRSATWVLAAATVATVAPAHADDDTASKTYRAVIDRVELEPAVIGGQRLRIHLSALSLTGGLVELGDSKLKITAGGSELKAPYALGRYAQSGGDTAIVFVVQTTIELTDTLPVIAAAIDENILATAGDHTQVAIVSYGETVGGGKLLGAKSARAKVNALTSDGSAGDPALLDTLERALSLLKRTKTDPDGRPLRKLIVVIGDGRDRTGDHDRVRRFGARAGREGIPIHALAYTPTNQRKSLLALGELAKRSQGTFRWVRGGRAESWNPALQQLRDEIDKQYVLTVFLAADDEVAGKKIKVATSGRVELVSNDRAAPQLLCGSEACDAGQYCVDKCVTPRTSSGRGFFGWILLILGLAVAVLVVLGVIGYVMTKRQQEAGIPKPVVPVAGQVPVPAPMPPMPAMGPKLYIMTGPRTGETIALRHGFLIGKAPHCALVIDDGYTSTTHAQIGMDDQGNCRIYDTGSTNGTFVNGVRVQEKFLEHGMTIRIGSTDLRFLAQ
jgi:FHA domain-containing protein